jgi:GMC oxidoreductase
LLQLIDAAGLAGFKDQTQAAREALIAGVASMSPEASGAIAALKQLSVLFAYSLPGPDGRNPLWVGMEYPGPAQSPPSDARKTLEVITPSGESTLEADVVVVGSGSGGGVAAALLAQAGKRVIILEAGGYWSESDFEQSELAAYQKLFLRGGFFPSADGVVSIEAGSTVGGGSTVNWSNSLLTPNTVRACWANAGLEDVDTPAFDEHLQAVFERIQCNDKVATQNGPHERLWDGASKLDYSYRVATLNIDPEKYDPNLIGYSGMGDQTGAKQGTMRTYLQDASDAGAKLLPNTWVNRILTDNGAAIGVEATYTDPVTQETSRVVINAPSVVAAAGSLETPGLLLRSGIGGPAVGAELRLHPASLVSAVYDEPRDPWYGPAMAGIMNEFAEVDEGFGYLIECVQHLPGLFTTVVPWLDGAAASIGTGPTGCSSSRTAAPEASPSTRTVNPRSGIRSPTISTVVISAKPR